MVLYRIGHREFIHDLEGTGARLYGGRWNPEGVACIYTSEHLSLALLEKFVHAQHPADMHNQAVIKFTCPADLPLYPLDPEKMKPDWTTNIAYTQWLGLQVLNAFDYAGFVVPSVIVPWEKNVILNPQSSAFRNIQVGNPFDFAVDLRMVNKI